MLEANKAVDSMDIIRFSCPGDQLIVEMIPRKSRFASSLRLYLDINCWYGVTLFGCVFVRNCQTRPPDQKHCDRD